jgi:hypothetical protein
MTSAEVAHIVLIAIKGKLSLWLPGGQGHITPQRLLIPEQEFLSDEAHWRRVLEPFNRETYELADTSVFAIVAGAEITYFQPSLIPFITTSR